MRGPISSRPTGGLGSTGLMRALLAWVLPYPGVSGWRCGGAARPALCGACSGLCRRASGSRRCWSWRRRACPRRSPMSPGRAFRGRRRAARPGGDPDRLRAVGAGPRHQRGGDPAPDPPWRRGRACRGRNAAAARWSTTWAASSGHASARRNIDAWIAEIERRRARRNRHHRVGLRHHRQGLWLHVALDPAYAEKAARISALAKDMTEYLASVELPEPCAKPGLVVAYHSACSMQHGQKITRGAEGAAAQAGFSVKEPREGHLCCGSAGTYNSCSRRSRSSCATAKWQHRRVKPDLIATGNIGCMTQIASGTAIPIVHTVELLDWGDRRPTAGGASPGRLRRVPQHRTAFPRRGRERIEKCEAPAAPLTNGQALPMSCRAPRARP